MAGRPFAFAWVIILNFGFLGLALPAASAAPTPETDDPFTKTVIEQFWERKVADKRLEASGCGKRKSNTEITSNAFLAGVADALNKQKFSSTHVGKVDEALKDQQACSEYKKNVHFNKGSGFSPTLADNLAILKALAQYEQNDLVHEKERSLEERLRKASQAPGGEFIDFAFLKADLSGGVQPVSFSAFAFKDESAPPSQDQICSDDDKISAPKYYSAMSFTEVTLAKSDQNAIELQRSKLKHIMEQHRAKLLSSGKTEEELNAKYKGPAGMVQLLIDVAEARKEHRLDLLDDELAAYSCCMRGYHAGESFITHMLTETDDSMCKGNYFRGWQIATASCKKCEFDMSGYIPPNVIPGCFSIGMKRGLAGCKRDTFEECKNLAEKDQVFNKGDPPASGQAQDKNQNPGYQAY